jgi:hypothetical protein
MGWVEKRLNKFGIPTKQISSDRIVSYDLNMVAKFVKGKKNMIVIGNQFYERCVKMMRLRMLNDASAKLCWMSQSQVNFESSVVGVDVLALVQLYEEESPSKKSLSGGLVNKVLSQGGQVLLGCSCTEALEGAFPYDVDMLEVEFEIWKESCKCGKDKV